MYWQIYVERVYQPEKENLSSPFLLTRNKYYRNENTQGLAPGARFEHASDNSHNSQHPINGRAALPVSIPRIIFYLCIFARIPLNLYCSIARINRVIPIPPPTRGKKLNDKKLLSSSSTRSLPNCPNNKSAYCPSLIV